uniref:Cytochrome c oxidase subunit 3 n=1 Tax=Parachtes limbarae TaxID=1110490 RepID=A0A516IMA0_9ARAC|nr:cytochrome c oxidase subunit 3 [Parachtes limbarae]
MVIKIHQPYHIVTMSPWPVLVSFNVMFVMSGMIKVFLLGDWMLSGWGFMGLVFCVIIWWRDVVRESTYQGCHNSFVISGLEFGMLLFILSEVFFFVSFFWAYFHFSLSPAMEMGVLWPPFGVVSFNAFGVPLLNTVILLASGVSVTWAHQGLLNNKNKIFYFALGMTWFLGVYFLSLQGFEYLMAMFDISYSVYGSIFYMATGFHGFHVLVGSLFLIVIWFRASQWHFSSVHHFGFEAAAWYWHFVDVVWLFLFTLVYWWGS